MMKEKHILTFDSVEEMQTWAKTMCGVPICTGETVPTVEPCKPIPVAPVIPKTVAPSNEEFTIPVAAAPPVAPPPVTAVAPEYTLDQFQTALVRAVDSGHTDDVLSALNTFGASALVEIKPEQYPAFAARLKEMGITV